MSDPSDTGAPYERDISNKLSMRVILTNIAQALSLYTPARDVSYNWAFGQDATYETLTASTANVGLAIDARHVNVDHRTFWAMCEGTISGTYRVLGGRDNDSTEAVELVSATAFGSDPDGIVVPASLGYWPWLFFEINLGAVAGNDLNYKVALLGRGG